MLSVTSVSIPLGWSVAVLVLEAAGVVALSPELGELGQILRKRPPDCTRASAPVRQMLALVHRSKPWMQVRTLLTKPEVVGDHWREGCWWFVAYRAAVNDRPSTAVFATHVPPGEAITTGVVIDDETDEVLLRLGTSDLGVVEGIKEVSALR